MRIYVDGSALRRYLSEVPCSAEWVAWASPRELMLVTSELAVSEMRRVADLAGSAARASALDAIDRLEVVRFSDQALGRAAMVAETMVAETISPFAALHLGIALTHPDVAAIATYDPQLAAVAELYALEVVTPGRAPGWWADE